MHFKKRYPRGGKHYLHFKMHPFEKLQKVKYVKVRPAVPKVLGAAGQMCGARLLRGLLPCCGAEGQ